LSPTEHGTSFFGVLKTLPGFDAILMSCTATAAATFSLNITEFQNVGNPSLSRGFTLDHQDKLEILIEAFNKAHYVVVGSMTTAM
jgi:hypothetical protein